MSLKCLFWTCEEPGLIFSNFRLRERWPPWTEGSSCWRRTWRGPRRGSPPPHRSWPRPPTLLMSLSGELSNIFLLIVKYFFKLITIVNGWHMVHNQKDQWYHYLYSFIRIRKALENKSNMEDDRVAILEAQLAQAKLIAEEADKKYEEVELYRAWHYLPLKLHLLVYG